MKHLKRFNLELYEKQGQRWYLTKTIIWNSHYNLCRGEKRKLEAIKSYFQFYKIVPN